MAKERVKRGGQHQGWYNTPAPAASERPEPCERCGACDYLADGLCMDCWDRKQNKELYSHYHRKKSKAARDAA